PPADVRAPGRALEGDRREPRVGAIARGAEVVAGADDREHAAAGRLEAAVLLARARVVDDDVADLLRVLEARDRLARLVGLGVAAARHHDADDRARVDV